MHWEVLCRAFPKDTKDIMDQLNNNMGKLKVGLFGFGCVGQGFYEIMTQHNMDNVEIAAICVKQGGKRRSLPDDRFVYDKHIILDNPEIGLIVELISDADEAFEIVSGALKKGLKVISANKKMLAEHLYELIELQQLYNGTLLYEASSCGSIPIIRTLEDFFAFEDIKKIRGIFNGSSNYILSKIDKEGSSYEKALEQAQALGFAEADPTLDVGGFDALNKLCVVTLHAFGVAIHPKEVLNFGIQNLRSADNQFAADKQHKIKQVAFSKRINANKLLAWVMPQFIKEDEELYTVENEFNAVLLEAAYAGSQLLKGKGAGAHPTGTAVFSDFKAIVNGYAYGYPKTKTVYAALDNGSCIKVYIRTDRAEIFEELKFKTIIEKGKVEQYDYLIGNIHIQELQKTKAVLEAANAFVAALPEEEQDFEKETSIEAEIAVKG